MRLCQVGAAFGPDAFGRRWCPGRSRRMPLTGLVSCRQDTIRSVSLHWQLPFTHAGPYGFQRHISMPVSPTDAAFIASGVARPQVGSDGER